VKKKLKEFSRTPIISLTRKKKRVKEYNSNP